MEVVKYPDPVLRRGGQPVTVFDQELAETAGEMLRTMYAHRGVGLAAPQVGLERDLLVLNPTGDPELNDQERILVNPRIVSKKGRVWGEEGCLSFPGLYVEVERFERIVVVYQDVEGREHEERAEDFLARVIQHEMDHLEGVLLTERMSPADRIRVKSLLLEMERRRRTRA